MNNRKTTLLISIAVLVLSTTACSPKTQTVTYPADSIKLDDAFLNGRVQMEIDGLSNIRDLGGYKTKDGKTVKKQLMYRSDTLSKLSPKGIEQVEQLNLGYIFDLRADNEIARKPDPQIAGAQYSQTEILADPLVRSAPNGLEEVRAFYASDAAKTYYMRGSRYMYNSSTSRKSIENIILSALGGNAEKAFLYHCSGGKDRTGYVSAIILSLLGVDNETIVKEYLLTNVDRKAFDDAERETMDKEYFKGDKNMMDGFLSIQQARARYVDIFLTELQGIYGTVDNYLILETGLTQEQLDRFKAIYTE
jgi:protein-tyrosine phosphatase